MSKTDNLIGILTNTSYLLLNEEDKGYYEIFTKAIDSLKKIKDYEVGEFIHYNIDRGLRWRILIELDKRPYSVEATKILWEFFKNSGLDKKYGLSHARACTNYIQENIDWYKDWFYITN